MRADGDGPYLDSELLAWYKKLGIKWILKKPTIPTHINCIVIPGVDFKDMHQKTEK